MDPAATLTIDEPGVDLPPPSVHGVVQTPVSGSPGHRIGGQHCLCDDPVHAGVYDDVVLPVQGVHEAGPAIGGPAGLLGLLQEPCCGVGEPRKAASRSTIEA